MHSFLYWNSITNVYYILLIPFLKHVIAFYAPFIYIIYISYLSYVFLHNEIVVHIIYSF